MKSMFGVTKNPYKKRYFVDAMNYFREEHLNPIFLYVSDDMEWGKKHLKGFDDLYFVGKLRLCMLEHTQCSILPFESQAKVLWTTTRRLQDTTWPC